MKTPLIVVAGFSLLLIPFAACVAAEEPLKAPATPPGGATAGAPEKPASFQPISLDPELVKQSMQARAEYENLNRQIIARQIALYTNNPTITELQVKMREIQKKIDAILAKDEELNKLKEKLKLVSPDMPIGMKHPVSKAPPAGGAAAVPAPPPPPPAPQKSDPK